jgi:GNAT superfamily N-acetyltransferase
MIERKVSTFTLTVHIEPASELLDGVRDALKAFNESCLGDYSSTQLLARVSDAEDRLIGGAHGWLQFGWLYVHILWVDDAHRRQGIGTRLMYALEDMARSRGITRARLQTADFQTALTFYRGLGYEVIAELPFAPRNDEPDRFIEYFMVKRTLAAPD